MTEPVLLFLYGAIVIASAFMIGSMVHLAIKEFHAQGPVNSARSTYFWLAIVAALDAGGLAYVCALRTFDGLNGVALGGSWGWALVVGFAVILGAKVGFNYAGTQDLKHGKLIWRSSLVAIGLWIVFLNARSIAG